MTTIRDIVTMAMKEAGVLGVGQSLLAEDINDGYTLFSRMLSAWQVKRWMVPGLTDISAVSNGAKSNRIGPGQFYNCARPDKILAAYFIQLTGTGGFSSGFSDGFAVGNNTNNIVSYPLRPIWSYEDYARLSLKNLNSWPQFFFYDGAFPNGNVYIWPVPSNQYEIHLIIKMPAANQTEISDGEIVDGGFGYSDGVYLASLTGGNGASGATANITVVGGIVTNVAIVNPGNGYNINDLLITEDIPTGYNFKYKVTDTTSSLDTEINLPDYYLEAIHYNLCIRLVSMYQFPANPVQGKLAKVALNIVKNANAQVPSLVIPYANRTGFNIYAPDVYPQ